MECGLQCHAGDVSLDCTEYFDCHEHKNVMSFISVSFIKLIVGSLWVRAYLLNNFTAFSITLLFIIYFLMTQRKLNKCFSQSLVLRIRTKHFHFQPLRLMSRFFKFYTKNPPWRGSHRCEHLSWLPVVSLDETSPTHVLRRNAAIFFICLVLVRSSSNIS